jgi:hypothetical protein
MTIRFRNPWIDPRVLDVRSTDVETYLRKHGWQETASDSPHWKRFLAPTGSDREAVLLPNSPTDETLVNLLVECVGKVATWERRFAGELLGELLPGASGTPPNGAAAAHAAAPA